MSTKTYTAREQAIIDSYRSRFDDERYRKAVEWLAGEDFELDCQDCRNHRFAGQKMREGATMAVAAMFGQSYNTVENDAWQFMASGEHNPRAMG